MTTRPKVSRMSEDDLRKFVDDLVSDRIFTSSAVGADVQMLKSIFLPIALGAFSDYSKEELDQIGCIYEDLEKRQHWCVNGYPTFLSCKVMHREDWSIAVKAAKAEFERRKNIPL
jgi:hypothetical protein